MACVLQVRWQCGLIESAAAAQGTLDHIRGAAEEQRGAERLPAGREEKRFTVTHNTDTQTNTTSQET